MKTLIAVLALAFLAGCDSPAKFAPLNSSSITAADRAAQAERMATDAADQAEQIRARTVRAGELEVYWEKDTVRRQTTGIRGTITNHGKQSVKYQQIRIDYLDADGRVIESAFTIAVDHLELRPGESRKWSMPWTGEAFKISVQPI